MSQVFLQQGYRYAATAAVGPESIVKTAGDFGFVEVLAGPQVGAGTTFTGVWGKDDGLYDAGSPAFGFTIAMNLGPANIVPAAVAAVTAAVPALAQAATPAGPPAPAPVAVAVKPPAAAVTGPGFNVTIGDATIEPKPQEAGMSGMALVMVGVWALLWWAK